MTVISRKTAWVVMFLYASVLAVVSLLPSGTGVFGGWDRAITPTVQNLLHLPAYCVLFLWGMLCLRNSTRPGFVVILIVVLACGAFGAGLEIAQTLVPGRMGSILDVLLNFAGVGLGLVAVILHRRAAAGGFPVVGLFLADRAERRRHKCWEIVKKHYHERGWRHAYKKYEDLLAEVLSHGSVALDVGCGRSFPLAEYLLECGAEVHGIDPVACEREAVVRGASLVRGTAYDIPYPDSSFDVVASRCVFEHLKDPTAAFTEFQRVLKPGGRAVFLTPSRYDYVSLFASLIPNSWHGKIVKRFEGRDEENTFPTFYKANTARQIKRLADRTGFAIERFQYHNCYPSMFMTQPVLCRVAIAYDELVSGLRRLHWLQGWILGCMRSQETWGGR